MSEEANLFEAIMNPENIYKDTPETQRDSITNGVSLITNSKEPLMLEMFNPLTNTGLRVVLNRDIIDRFIKKLQEAKEKLL